MSRNKLIYACFLTAVHLFGLTWQLQPVGQIYANGISNGNTGTESMDTTYSPIGGKVSDKSEKKGTVTKMIDGFLINFFLIKLLGPYLGWLRFTLNFIIS